MANSEKKIDLQRLFGYNISRMTVTVISYVLLRPGRAVEHIEFDRRCIPNEAYLSAQPPSPLQGSRFPPENGYFQWP